MTLLEHEAKSILAQFSLPVPKSTLITASSEVPPLPTILKSQVPVGGRGKAGGIKKATSVEEFTTLTQELLAKPIKGFTPKTLLAEEPLAINKEYYLSLLINRADETIELLAHPDGGVEIESHPADSFLRIPLAAATIKSASRQLSDLYRLPNHQPELEDLLTKLLACFTGADATLLEINPLILTAPDTKNSNRNDNGNHNDNPRGNLIAGDCKMTLDDAAAFRHPEWHFEATTTEANFVTLNQYGVVATIANGAGLAMATVDAVASAGLTPANFLDIGGGANSDTVLAAFQRIMEFPHIQAIVINIFAGITRCDEVAKAIIEARTHISNLPPLFIRLAGTNVDSAATLLAVHNIPLLPSLETCIDQARTSITPPIAQQKAAK